MAPFLFFTKNLEKQKFLRILTHNINANNMQELKQFIEKMRATSSSLDKVEILKKQSNFIKEVLEYTYSPYKQYNVTSETCKKNSKIS